MKFIISTQEFNVLLNKCLNVVAAKAAIPILANVYITASKGKLTLMATDLIMGIVCTADAQVLEEGATTLPAKRLAQLVRELNSPTLEITTHPTEVTDIVADASRFKLLGMNKNEFPTLSALEGATQIRVSQKEFKDALFRTAFAVSREDNRYALTGVSLHIEQGEATFVGTDGKRLSRTFMPINADPQFQGRYILPLKTVEELLKNLSDDGEATLHLLSDKIAVETGNVMMITKLLSDEYPDVSRVIPDSSSSIVALHRDELMSLLRQVSLFTTANNHSVRFAFNPGELHLSANNAEFGEGKVSMPVNYEGQPLEIAFNPNFFLDILRHTRAQSVAMGLTDSYNPGVISDTSSEQDPATAKSLFVLMPLRLEE